jgi:hypothetical protein
MADIPVSYTSSDREWVLWIAQELEALGHKSRVQRALTDITGSNRTLAWQPLLEHEKGWWK